VSGGKKKEASILALYKKIPNLQLHVKINGGMHT
jgi:hypothetical protein